MNLKGSSTTGHLKVIKSARSTSSTGAAMWFLKAALAFSLLLNVYFFTGGPSFQSSTAAPISQTTTINGSLDTEENELRIILEKAAMPNRTIIVTHLNEAWIAPNSMFDLFLESFRIGNNTQWLLKHLLVLTLDEKAHLRCIAAHPHCYQLRFNQALNVTQAASYMTPNYLRIVWRKLGLLHRILSLGFNFLFTDGDVMWLQNPFPRLLSDNSNIQVSCDKFNGDSRSPRNPANTGFLYVVSDPKTILLYEIWYASRHNYRRRHDQHVFDIMKSGPLFEVIGLKVKFLDTTYFSGFCQLSKDISKVCTVHGMCCVGLTRKASDLRLVLDDWSNYTSSSASSSAQNQKNGTSLPFKWSVPKLCARRK